MNDKYEAYITKTRARLGTLFTFDMLIPNSYTDLKDKSLAEVQI